MTVAFFDIDKTILSVNSAKRWIRFELNRGSITKRQALRGAWWAGLYGLGLADVEHFLYEAVAQLEGREEATLRQETYDFFEREIRNTIRPGAWDAIARHRDRGDHIVLLTSSSIYMAEAVQGAVDADDALANMFVIEDGIFTGKPIEPLCYHRGKIAHASRWAKEHDESLSDAIFYTDSFTDLPMLEVVGEPVVVHPDPRLKREALKRGWAVQNWGG